MEMAAFIALSIKKAEDKNGTGREKYTGYFITVTLYQQFRADVDSILTIEGYSQCIVA